MLLAAVLLGSASTFAQTFTVGNVSFKMVPVEGGTFTMGDKNRIPTGRDLPAHQVTLSSFSIGQTEVTQELWNAVMGSNPSKFFGDKLPVVNVNWNDCQVFIEKLNVLTGKNFRLPTEAEWEYAARGGKQSQGFEFSGSSTLSDVAWYYENSGDNHLDEANWSSNNLTPNNCRTHTVATKSPNELGLHDMSGNVLEWCQDWDGAWEG